MPFSGKLFPFWERLAIKVDGNRNRAPALRGRLIGNKDAVAKIRANDDQGVSW